MFSKKLAAVIISLSMVAFGVPAGAETDPFPGVAKGQEIPGTRISSEPGQSWADFNATSAVQNFSCPAGSGSALESNIGAQIRSYYCVKTWESSSSTAAWDSYYQQVEAAKAAALAESRAWNEANPGRQKCIQWGPITDPNGGTASGGVCANPVEPTEDAPATPSEDAPSVSEDDIVPESPQSPGDNETPNPNENTGEVSDYEASGSPFTVVLEGQVSKSQCPSGYQAASGIIADASTGKTYTQCWPADAWTAYRLGGAAWQQFKDSGGEYDPNVEQARQNNVESLKSKALQVAQAAAKQTPGIERCSSWEGFGESGRECAFELVDPSSLESEEDLNAVTDDETEESNSSDAQREDPEAGSNTEGSEEVSAETFRLEPVAISGNSIEVSELAPKLIPNEEEAVQVKTLAEGFTKVPTTQRTLFSWFPRDPELEYSVKSSTPDVCLASSWRVRIHSPGLCLVDVGITDSSGNELEIIKRMRRWF